MYSTQQDHDLGLSIAAVGGAISTIGGLFGGGKDDGRLDANAKAYSQALSSPLTMFKDQGVQPTAFLLMKSPTSKGGQGGWATSKAQNDAYSKYTSAISTLKSRKYTVNNDGSVNAPPSQSYPSSSVPSGAAPAPSAGAPMGGPVIAGLSTGPLLIAGAAALAAVMLSKRR